MLELRGSKDDIRPSQCIVFTSLLLTIIFSQGPLTALDFHHNSFLPPKERETETLNILSISVMMKFHWSGLDLVLLFEQITVARGM